MPVFPNNAVLKYTEFTLLGGYPTYKIEHGGMSAERRGILPWNKLDQFVKETLPPSTYAGGNYTFLKGAKFPNRDNLRACSLDIKPFVDKARSLEPNGPDYVHDYWDVTIYYKSDNDPYFSHNWSSGGEVFTVAESALCWDNILPTLTTTGGFGWSLDVFQSGLNTSVNLTGTNAQADGNLGIVRGVRPAQSDKLTPRMLVPHIEHQVTWHRVMRPPYTAIRACLGKVNGPKIYKLDDVAAQAALTTPVVVVAGTEKPDSDVVNFRTGPVPRECLLFTGCQINRIVQVDGNWSYELVYKFSERQVEAQDQYSKGGWNHFFRAAQRKPVNVSTNQGAVKFFMSVCTGKPGFYRLEKTGGYIKDEVKSFVDNQSNPIDDPCATGGAIPDPPVPVTEDYLKLWYPDLVLGYQKEIAIYQQEWFGALFVPEPPGGLDPAQDPNEPTGF